MEICHNNTSKSQLACLFLVHTHIHFIMTDFDKLLAEHDAIWTNPVTQSLLKGITVTSSEYASTYIMDTIKREAKEAKGKYKVGLRKLRSTLGIYISRVVYALQDRPESDNPVASRNIFLWKIHEDLFVVAVLFATLDGPKCRALTDEITLGINQFPSVPYIALLAESITEKFRENGMPAKVESHMQNLIHKSRSVYESFTGHENVNPQQEEKWD